MRRNSLMTTLALIIPVSIVSSQAVSIASSPASLAINSSQQRLYHLVAVSVVDHEPLVSEWADPNPGRERHASVRRAFSPVQASNARD